MFLLMLNAALAQDAVGPVPAPEVVFGPEAPPAPVVEAPPVEVASEVTPAEAASGAAPGTEANPIQVEPTPLTDWMGDGAAESVSAPSQGLAGQWWFLPLGLAIAGGAYLLREKLKTKLDKASGDRIDVLSRTSLTAKASVILMEVPTGDGGSRRLLVGVGDGPPSLVADLGGEVPGFSLAVVDEEEEDEQPAAEDLSNIIEAGPAQEHIVVPDLKQSRGSRRGVARRFQQGPANRPPSPGHGAAVQVPKRFTGRFSAEDLMPDEELDDTPVVRPRAWRRPPKAAPAAPEEEVLGTRDLLERRL